MGKPQDLPSGHSQMKVGIVLAFVTYVMAVSRPYGFGLAVAQAFIDLIGTGIIVWFALKHTDQLSRFPQAFGGLCGASAFINLASLPIYLFRTTSVNGEPDSSGMLAEFVLLVWGLSLLAHIIRHTFDVKMVVSVFIAFVYVLVWSSLITTFLPPPALIQPEVLEISQAIPLSKLLDTVPFNQPAAFELVASTVTVL